MHFNRREVGYSFFKNKDLVYLYLFSNYGFAHYYLYDNGFLDEYEKLYFIWKKKSFTELTHTILNVGFSLNFVSLPLDYYTPQSFFSNHHTKNLLLAFYLSDVISDCKIHRCLKYTLSFRVFLVCSK